MQQLEREGTGSDSGSNKLVIDTSRDNSVVSGGGTVVSAADEVDNVAVKKSEPLLITTQPINDKARLMSINVSLTLGRMNELMKLLHFILNSMQNNIGELY